ncbi:DEAD/DEAH box helicase [Pseudokineococcus basanitobsidens]|uniref:DEAD/DEAH box helicase n=1 Tax=Pseudokineococcus basanitobsidens TaxID=1926649 RepID=UPI003BB7165A
MQPAASDGGDSADETTDDDAPEADRGPTFADLGIRREVLRALDGLGYEEPTPIQAESIRPLMAGHDLLGQAATGTGKTAAFALPLLEKVPAGGGRSPVGLVLVPTRELAIQVSEAIATYGKQLGARVLAVYGGTPIGRQLRELQRGVDVVVATPGRAIDHIGRGTLPLGGVQTVVLDEADEMLDMGFAEDIEEILSAAPAQRQTVLFSATMPPRIDRIARQHLTEPVRIRIAKERTAEGEAPRVRQTAYVVGRQHKVAALGRILDLEQPNAALVFCRTREEVDTITERLGARGYRAEALHGGMSQEQRDKVVSRLRAGAAQLLIATDVAARGLDVEQLSHVVNFDVPSAPESYVHRIGRVGRAGREGVALTLAEPRERRQLSVIERVAGAPITIAPLPTVADLRAHRLGETQAAVAAVLAGDRSELDEVRGVLDALLAEHGAEEVALAALRMAHAAQGAVDDVEIPAPDSRPARDVGPRGAGSRDRGDSRGPASRGGRTGPRSGPAAGNARLFVGVGRRAGVRPADLVGAIANESPVKGKDIGAIEITERFSLVEVPERAADDVVAALRGSTIKGRRAQVRLDRDAAR